jgi:hypothetical protein
VQWELGHAYVYTYICIYMIFIVANIMQVSSEAGMHSRSGEQLRIVPNRGVQNKGLPELTRGPPWLRVLQWDYRVADLTSCEELEE